MPILTNSGRVAIANALAKLPLHVAWGTGDGAWIAPPSENNAATALMAEVGRRKITQWKFVVPDAAGAIEVPSGKFSFSPGNAPTNHLWVQANFDFSEASGSEIREVAVYSDIAVDPGLPPGKMYFTPGEVVAPGLMLYLDNITPISRSPSIQENIEVVITF